MCSVEKIAAARNDNKNALCCGVVLPIGRVRDRSYDMKQEAVTVRLDNDLKPLLDEVCRRLGRTRSEVVREALRRHLAQLRFERLRRRVMPFAEARGYLTDEDVFKHVS